MAAFRALLIVLFASVVGYTVVVISDHGFSLFPVFFGDIAEMAWPGQFNVDFLAMLCLSAFWLAWRNDFSPLGLALGTLGFFGGAPVLTAYLFLTTLQCRGDVRQLLLGSRRASG